MLKEPTKVGCTYNRWKGLIILFRRIKICFLECNDTENMDIAKEVSNIWYLAQQVSIVAGGKISYKRPENKGGVFCERTDRQMKSERSRG
jgi:hypothetical protein